MKKDNVASRATAAANGMKMIGEYYNSENEITAVYSITRGEWKNQQK